MKFMKDSERKQFIDNRDLLRLVEEQKESARRRELILNNGDEAKAEQAFQECLQGL